MTHHGPRGAPSPGDRPTAYPILGFLLFSHGWTWVLWSIAGTRGESVWTWPGVMFFYLGGAGVAVGGVVMTARLLGRAGLSDLGRRIVDPRRIPWPWGVTVVLLYPVLTGLAAVLAVAAGLSIHPLDGAGALDRLREPSSFLWFVVFILIAGPLPEEIGWRGYLLDRLQSRATALGASLVLGLVWWSWHLPLFVLPGYFDAFTRASPTPFEILWGLLPAAIVYTWIYNNTGRSVLAVIVLHFLHNFTGAFLGMDETVRPVRLLLEWGVALGVVLRWGPRTLVRMAPAPSDTT